MILNTKYYYLTQYRRLKGPEYQDKLKFAQHKLLAHLKSRAFDSPQAMLDRILARHTHYPTIPGHPQHDESIYDVDALVREAEQIRGLTYSEIAKRFS